MPPALNTEEQAITFSDRNDFDAAQLLHLYRQAPWAKYRDLEQTRAMLAKTDVVISAWDGTRLVAFGRVLTDYVYRATIWDVIVDRNYQGRKIGTEIVRRILNHPALQQVELFWLCTRMPGFYERLGFSAKEQTGMVWSRKKSERPR
jgi:ribosomal protein S18 acetylase RimI-like enzyme